MDPLQKIKEDLSRHFKKSYKFVTYKAFLELQENGSVSEKEFVKYIRNFYEQRKINNRKIETSDSKIIDLLNSKNIERLQKYIEKMPLNKLETLRKKEIIEMNRSLWDQLQEKDLKKLYNFIEQKLAEYYQTKVGDEYVSDSYPEFSEKAQLNKVLYLKEIDWSVFNDGLTIPLEYHNIFFEEVGERIEPGEHENIKLIFSDREYSAKLYNIDRGVKKDTLSIRYKKNVSLYLQNKFPALYSAFKKNREENSEKADEVIETFTGFFEIRTSDRVNSFEVDLYTKVDAERLSLGKVNYQINRISSPD